jgi:hypothetical protein
VVRGVLRLAAFAPAARHSLFDAAGRAVLRLHAGPNDVAGLAPGVYLIRVGDRVTGRVVVAR